MFVVRSEIGANHLCREDMCLMLFSTLYEIACKKTLIAAEFVGVDVKLALDSQIPSSSISYFKTNPNVTALQTPDGPIFGSNAIIRYVSSLKADNPLHGSSFYDYGRIEEWISFATSGIHANIEACLQCLVRIGCAAPLTEAAENIAALKRALGALNMHLASNTYLVGDSVTLADIILICDLYLGFTQLMPQSFTSEFPHVERYFWRLVKEPNFKKILGEVKQFESVPHEPKPEAGEEEEASKPKHENPLRQKERQPDDERS